MIPSRKPSERIRKKPKEKLEVLDDDDDDESRTSNGSASVSATSSSGGDSSDDSSPYGGLSSDEDDDNSGVITAQASTVNEDEETADSTSQFDGMSELSNSQLSRRTSKDPLARLLRGDSSLKEMEINYKLLKDWTSALSLDDVMKEISTQYSITKLTLDMDRIPASLHKEIFTCIKNSSTITDVHLYQTKFDRDSSRALGVALAESKNSPLQRMSLNKCDFSGSGLAILFLAIQHIPNLAHISLKNISLGGFASEIVSASFSFISTLQSLELIQTSIPEEGIRYLCSNLAKAKNLTNLDLSQNNLSAESARIVGRCIGRDDSNIATLTLRSCALDELCVSKLCKGISDEGALRTIDLTSNPFGDRGAKALIAMLERNNQVQEITISKCGVGEKRETVLKDRLRYNNSFLKNVFSTEVSLAILDSVGLMENISTSFG